jgi:hypothetical protein
MKAAGKKPAWSLATRLVEKPRMHARFFDIVLLRRKELSDFDRAFMRGSGRPSANFLSILFHGVNPLYNHHGIRGAENRGCG